MVTSESRTDTDNDNDTDTDTGAAGNGNGNGNATAREDVVDSNSSNSDPSSQSEDDAKSRTKLSSPRRDNHTSCSHNNNNSNSNRIERCLTILDNAIQYFIDDDDNDDNDDDDGKKNENENDDSEKKRIVWIKGSKLLQKVIRKTARIEFNVHNMQHRNTLFLVITTISVVPFTRILCLFLMEKMLYLLLTALGTAIGIAMGIIVGMHSYQLLTNPNGEEGGDDGDGEDDGEDEDDADVHADNNSRSRSRSRSMSMARMISSGSTISAAQASIHTPPKPNPSSSSSSSSSKNNASPNTYPALMAVAGYDVHTLSGITSTSSNANTKTKTKTKTKTSTNISSNSSTNTSKMMHQRGQILRNVTDSTQQSFTFIKHPLQRNSIYTNSTPTILNANGTDSIGSIVSTGSIGSTGSTGAYESKGMTMFQRLFPLLPNMVQKELGEVIDFITRDYIISWYHIVDDAVGYENEVERRKRLQREDRNRKDRERDRDHDPAKSEPNNDNDNVNDKEPKDEMHTHTQVAQVSNNDAARNIRNGQDNDANDANGIHTRNTNNLMILSTTPTRTIPFLEIFYAALTTLLGNLSTTCEHINVPHLVLYKFMHILKVNIRTFKDIRKIVLKKQEQKKKRRVRKRLSLIHVGARIGNGNGNGSGGGQGQGQGQGPDDSTAKDTESKSMEIAIVREYLLQGKLHRAITFGMDVPGLLFGDATGKECPIPSTHADANEDEDEDEDSSAPSSSSDEDAILEQRLFGNGRRILHECEVDYNRVLAHRLCKILFPKPDFASPVLRSASIELLATMILTPIMGCFTPDYLNGWIITGLSGKKKKDGDGDDGLDDKARDEKDSSSTRDGDVDASKSGKTKDGDDQFDLEEELDDEELDVALDVGNSLDDHDSFDDVGVGDSSANTRAHSVGDTDISDEILALLAMSLIELQAHIDFDEARDAKSNGEELETRWNDQGCIETVRNLVLVIEAMLMHGVLLKKRKNKIVITPPAFAMGEDLATSVPEAKNKEYTSLIGMMMEMTGDLEAFENDTMNEIDNATVGHMYEEDAGDLRSIQRPKTGDLSTLRSLIAAWLHTGVVYPTLSVLMRSRASILHPFYHNDAFIRKQEHIDGFLRQLRGLKDVAILVDTMTILSHPPLDLYKMEDERKKNKTTPGFFPATSPADRSDENNIGTSMKGGLQAKLKFKIQEQNKNGLGGSIKANFENNRKRLSRLVRPGENRLQSSPTSRVELSPSHKKEFLNGAFGSSMHNQSYSSYLEFHRNEALAASLRSERDARLASFNNLKDEFMRSKRVMVETICRSKVKSKDHFLEHRDLHNLAKGFYSNTTSLSLRHIYTGSPGINCEEGSEEVKEPETILVMENVATRRKWAIPDDDSSFLLRAQPVQLNVVGIHRDQRSNSLSYKKYAAYFDEPLAHVESNEFRGAKLRRKCYLRYYPNDRTAAINVMKNDHKLDSNLGRLIEVETSGSLKQIKEFDRYLCNKSTREGSERAGGALSNSILASTVMDSNDFNSVPRSGKAQDFVYRVSLFEEPEVELSGKKFIIEDAASVGVHRSDASSLEISDAALSTSLLLGQKYDKRNKKQFHVKCDDLQIPVIFLKFGDRSVDPGSPLSASSQRKHQDGGFRQYRVSFVRAALLVASARKEAQLQCLLSVSPKNVTRSRSDKLLQPTLTLLDFATSENRERQAILLRDLKLGINHIDKDQLRRSGILSPRYPTRLRALKVVMCGTVEAKSNQGLDLLVGPSSILYKLRCVAITEYVGVDSNNENIEYGDLIREEWVVMRSFKDFTTFHKFLKTQVNSAESSAGTGAKLTGLATAALTLGISSHSESKRKALIPSLNKAVQAGALGATKKCIEKRKEILNDYLSHLLSKRNLLNRCPELLRFVGAYDPLPESVRLGSGVVPDLLDGLGRSEMSKRHLPQGSKVEASAGSSRKPSHPIRSLSIEKDDNNNKIVLRPEEDSRDRQKKATKKSKKHVDPARLAMIASIKSRVDRVKLSKVRGSIFELIRYIFDLDSANFFRSQMVAAVQTMSIAFTTGHGFKRTLIELHLKYLSSRSVSSYIKFVKDLMWPNGIIFTSAIPLTPEASREVANDSRKILQEVFPDQLQAVLGTEITENGLDLFHEMLNNRLVLKSMIYMMADTLLLEAFPEMRDILTCSQVLDS